MAMYAKILSPRPVTCCDCGLACERTSNRQKRCPNCQREHHAKRQRAYRKDNPEKIAHLNRQYRQKQSERLKRLDYERHLRMVAENPKAVREAATARSRAYRERKRQQRLNEGWVPRVPMTPEQKRQRVREVAAKRYHADPLRARMSAAVRRVLRGKKLGQSWEALVGYNSDDLRRHLERQFLPKMNWHNIDEWHVDHIVPLREFDCSDENQFKAAWALSNLRPLWALENCKKGGKRLTLL